MATTVDRKRALSATHLPGAPVKAGASGDV